MIKNSTLALLLTVFMVACGGGGGSDKKAELEKLKKQKTELETKIAALEEAVAKSDTTSKKEKGIEVVVMPVVPSIFKAYIEVQGRVDADENVSVTSEAPGTVTKISVKVGDHVTKGQVLAETDARAVQQQLAMTQTSLALVNQMYEKQKSLWEQKIGTEMQYLQVKTQKEATENYLNMLNEQIRMSKITSPIDGTIDLVNIKVGQAVGPGNNNNVINVVNFNSLKVKADVAEGYALRIHNGDEVIVVFPDMNDTIHSKIHYASRAINPASRTFAVEAFLENNKEYHPNTVAKLRINDYRSAKPVIVVPVKFIQKGEEGSYVMVDEKGKAAKKAVVLGREYNGNAEVLSGLNEGDLLITEGYDLVNEGNSIVSVKK